MPVKDKKGTKQNWVKNASRLQCTSDTRERKAEKQQDWSEEPEPAIGSEKLPVN